MNIAWFIECDSQQGILARLDNGTVIHVPSWQEYEAMQGVAPGAEMPPLESRNVRTLTVGDMEFGRYKEAAKVMGATYQY